MTTTSRRFAPACTPRRKIGEASTVPGTASVRRFSFFTFFAVIPVAFVVVPERPAVRPNRGQSRSVLDAAACAVAPGAGRDGLDSWGVPAPLPQPARTTSGTTTETSLRMAYEASRGLNCERAAT